MKLFEVSGVFRKGKINQHPFKVQVKAEKEERAQEKAYIFLGSKQKCPRRWINIQAIKEARENSEEFSGPRKSKGFSSVLKNEG